MKDRTPKLSSITRRRRQCELVAIAPSMMGVAGIGLAATVSWQGEGQIRREYFSHDETPEGLATALEAVSAWIRRTAAAKDGGA